MDTKPNIQRLTPYVPGRTIEDILKKYRPKRVVKLGSNENPLGTSSKALTAMKKELARISLYPDSHSEILVEALARHHKLDTSWILPGNGSDEILLLAAAAYIRPGDKAVMSECTFSQYERSTLIFAGEPLFISQKKFKHDLKSIAAYAVKYQVRMVFLCNPNNPTGTYFNHTQLDVFLKSLPGGCVAVLDEAYSDFATARNFPRSVALLKKYPQLLLVRTFSKSHGLAGIRVGYALAHPPIIEQMNRVRNFNPFNVNSLAQKGAAAALTDRAFIRKTIQSVEKGRIQIEKGLKKLKLKSLPSQANFICFRVPGAASILSEKLATRGMIMRPLGSFGLPDWCRVTVGTAQQNRFFLNELARSLKSVAL